MEEEATCIRGVNSKTDVARYLIAKYGLREVD